MTNYAGTLDTRSRGETAKCAECPGTGLIIGDKEGEHGGRSRYFSTNAVGPKLEPATSISDEKSTQRTRVDALALKAIAVEIETRELELRTLRRARDVLAHDVLAHGASNA